MPRCNHGGGVLSSGRLDAGSGTSSRATLLTVRRRRPRAGQSAPRPAMTARAQGGTSRWRGSPRLHFRRGTRYCPGRTCPDSVDGSELSPPAPRWAVGDARPLCITLRCRTSAATRVGDSARVDRSRCSQGRHASVPQTGWRGFAEVRISPLWRGAKPNLITYQAHLARSTAWISPWGACNGRRIGPNGLHDAMSVARIRFPCRCGAWNMRFVRNQEAQ